MPREQRSPAEAGRVPVARRRDQSYREAVGGSTVDPGSAAEFPADSPGAADGEGWPRLIFGSLALRVAGVVR